MPDLDALAHEYAERVRRSAMQRGGMTLPAWVFNVLETEGDARLDDIDDLEALRDAICALVQPQHLHQGGINATRPPVAEEDRTAPFRFVAIADPVLAPEAVRTTDNAKPLEGGYSGYIDVEWAVETALLIGDMVEQRVNGRKESVAKPLQIGSDYAIPGATLRGMVRATMEIVCRARLSQVNAHHRYGVRDFDHPLFADGASRLAWDALGSGWLRKATCSTDPPKQSGDSDYVIETCKKHRIRIRDLPASVNGGSTGDRHLAWLRKKIDERYAAAGMRTGNTFDFDKTYSFKVGSPIGAGPWAFTPLVPDATGSVKGTYVFAGKSPTFRNNMNDAEIDEWIGKLDAQDAEPDEGDQKKLECIFEDYAPGDPARRVERVKQSAFDRFHLINSKPGKNKREPDGTYKALAPTLKEGQRIPVFFAGSLDDQEGDNDKSKRLDIGLTRLFKIGHDYSVRDILGRHAKHALDPAQPDMVEALFGYVYESTDLEHLGERGRAGAMRKGRIGFGFAYLENGNAAVEDTQTIATVMMAPRASFAPFYLGGRTKDWSEPNARLAGRKRYFPRFATAQAIAASSAAIDASLLAVQGTGETKSLMRFLRQRAPATPLFFKGRIKLHNVLAEEVGALLWALTHGGDPTKPYRHMIGRGKPAGAGQVRVKSIALNLEGHDAEADTLLVHETEDWEKPAPAANNGVSREGWNAGEQSLAPFLCRFDEHMRNAADTTWPQVNDIRELLGAASPAVVNSRLAGRTAYPQFPNGFRSLKIAVKLHTREGPPAAGQDRLLAAPMEATVSTPYRR